MSPVVEALKEQYGDRLNVIYRHLPLISIHDNALLAAEASEAAGAQGKFWEMHDLLYLNQNSWSSLGESALVDELVDYADQAGVEDLELFCEEIESDIYEDKVMADYNAAGAAGLSSTPSFVINQVDYPGRAFGLSYEGIDTFLKLMELREDWYDGPEQVIDPSKDYQATIETENGDIVIELYPDTAPANVNSFAFLAQEGWYEDTTFHRVLPDFVAQGGDPTGTGIGFPGYRCGDEVVSSRSFDEAGLVALANSGPDTNGAQFFITYDAAPNLNDGFTIIGNVTEGYDVVEQLTPRNPQPGLNLVPGDKIINIIVEEQ